MRFWKHYLKFVGMYTFILVTMSVFMLLATITYTAILKDDSSGWTFFGGASFFSILLRLYIVEYSCWKGRHPKPNDWTVQFQVNGWDQKIHVSAHDKEEAQRKALKYLCDFKYGENGTINSLQTVSVERD